MDDRSTVTLESHGAQALDIDPLFQPYRLGPFNLWHRIVMVPLTRSRACQPGNVADALAACYYAQRACARGHIATPAVPRPSAGQKIGKTSCVRADERHEVLPPASEGMILKERS
jgi:N-ethylmaleimide reductase